MCCGLFLKALDIAKIYEVNFMLVSSLLLTVVYLSFGFVPQSTLQFWFCKRFALTNLKSASQILVIDVLLIINGLL